jgi:hypothetical protein
MIFVLVGRQARITTSAPACRRCSTEWSAAEDEVDLPDGRGGQRSTDVRPAAVVARRPAHGFQGHDARRAPVSHPVVRPHKRPRRATAGQLHQRPHVHCHQAIPHSIRQALPSVARTRCADAGPPSPAPSLPRRALTSGPRFGCPRGVGSGTDRCAAGITAACSAAGRSSRRSSP